MPVDASAQAVRRSLLRRPSVLLGTVVLGAGLGLGIDVARVGGVDAWLRARGPAVQAEWPAYDPRGRVVEVDGRGVYVDCRGPATADASGRPTVILEAGFGSGAGAWGHVFDGVAEFTRVCAWDRPGLGRSESRGGHSPSEALDDLWRALELAGEHPPYVVAGHSFGGVYARILAGQRPGAVAALLMIDAYYPDIGIEDDPSLPADFREAFARSLDETAGMLAAGEDLDWPRVLRELDDAGPFEGPTIMLSAGLQLFHTDPDANARIHGAFEVALHEMFPNGRLEYVPNTGHLIQIDRPDVVIERIRELVELARAGTAQRSP